MDNVNRINCYKCRFFYVTWDEQHPNGCRALGFKSKRLPSIVVEQSSGKPCEFYREKTKKSSDPS